MNRCWHALVCGVLLAGCEATGASDGLWGGDVQARRDALYPVVEVLSGDTLVVDFSDGGLVDPPVRVTVRLHGCRAPAGTAAAETGEPRGYLGESARDRLAALLAGGWVRLEFENSENRPADTVDDSGPVAIEQSAYVFTPPPPEIPHATERCVNLWVIDEGLARRDPEVTTPISGGLGGWLLRMDGAEARAREARRGTWAVPQ